MARDVVEVLRVLATAAWPPFLTADEGAALLAVVEAAKAVGKTADGTLYEGQPAYARRKATAVVNLRAALARLYAGSSRDAE